MPFEFEVFKPGEYPQGVFTPEVVRQMVADYDPGFLEAPVTVDHEQWGAALGWVKGLRLGEGDVVVADMDLHPLLYAAYKNGEFKKRSVEIIRMLPDTKRPYLGAVTFLGAKNPQVNGLADPKFSNPEERMFIDYDESRMEGGKRMSKFKEAMRKIFAKAVDEFDEKELGITPAADGAPPPEPPPVAAAVQDAAQFSVEERKRFAATEAENKELKAKLAASEETQRKESIHAFCEGLKTEGKLLPAWQEGGLETFMLKLEGLDGKLKFSDKADDAEQTAAEFFRKFLEGMPKLVEFNEHAGKDKEIPKGATDEHEFMAVSRALADEKKWSMSKAMGEVVKNQPELHAAFLEHQAQLTTK